MEVIVSLAESAPAMIRKFGKFLGNLGESRSVRFGTTSNSQTRTLVSVTVVDANMSEVKLVCSSPSVGDDGGFRGRS